jgi:membrane associated rhomboid family serine protease
MIPLRDAQPSRSTPAITYAIIAINAAVFFHELSLDPYSRNYLFETWGVVPARFHFTAILTSMFLHGGWLHIIGNMWFLWIFGDNIEDILGHWKYLAFYLLCGIAAGLVYVVLTPDSPIPTIGASGAIAGVMGAYLVKFPRARILTLVFLFFVFFVEVPASVLLIYWFFIQLISWVGTIGYSSVSQQGGVAFVAHVGGFLTGILLIYLFPTRRPYGRRQDLYW